MLFRDTIVKPIELGYEQSMNSGIKCCFGRTGGFNRWFEIYYFIFLSETD